VDHDTVGSPHRVAHAGRRDRRAVTENRRLLKAGVKAIGDTLASLTTFSATYDSHGGAVRRGDGPTFLDEQA